MNLSYLLSYVSACCQTIATSEDWLSTERSNTKRRTKNEETNTVQRQLKVVAQCSVAVD